MNPERQKLVQERLKHAKAEQERRARELAKQRAARPVGTLGKWALLDALYGCAPEAAHEAMRALMGQPAGASGLSEAEQDARRRCMAHAAKQIKA